MKPYRVSASARIEAEAERIYNILADYHHGHPSILPKPYFLSLTVERGGYGAGTIIGFQTRVLGQTRKVRAAITEPEPGRVLVETDLEEGGAVTTFTLVPVDDLKYTQVTISSERRTRQSGLLGLLERWLAEWILRRIYRLEMGLLAERAKGSAGTDDPGAHASAGSLNR